MQEDFAAVHRINELPVAGPSNPSSSKQAQPSEPAVAASSKLEPFLVLARSARGPGAAAIVVDQVTSATGVFCFGELFEVQAIAEVRRHQQQSSTRIHDPDYYMPATCSLKALSSTEESGYCFRSLRMAFFKITKVSSTQARRDCPGL